MTPFRAILSWFLLLTVAVANGGLREVAYPAALGDFAARQVATGIGAAAIGAAIWVLLRRWPIRRAPEALAVGALWTALTIAFEVGFGRARGLPWDAIRAQYALWDGQLWPLLLAWLLVAPAALSALARSGVAVGPTLRWAIAGWVACGLVLAMGRAALGLEGALVLHLFAAPLIAAAITLFLWTHPRHPGVLGTAAALGGVAAFLDAVFVAPFLERSWAMFASPVGTWMPLALIFGASAATGALLARPAARRGLLGWIPTRPEQGELLPGDALLPAATGATHAITIAAPPAAVWPWLVQMGWGRAGWYSHDALDHGGRSSATAIRPELQALRVGDRLPSSPGGRTYFEVMELSDGRHLVLGAHLVWPLRSRRWTVPSSRVWQRATWAFVLRPTGDGATRLVVRARAVSHPVWLWALWDAVFSVAHVLMQRKQLLGIRRRAERALTRAASAPDRQPQFP